MTIRYRMEKRDTPQPLVSPQFIDAAGHRTLYRELGAGEPVVLLHGSGPGVSGWANWSRIAPVLADGFRVLVPDIAGFGDTLARPGERYGIKLWVAHLLGFLDALGIQRAHLVGNSFGGALAIGVATAAAHRVQSLVLMGTPAGEFPMSEGLRAGWFYEPGIEAMASLLRLFPYDQSLVTSDMVDERYVASARPGAQDAFRALIPQPSTEAGATVKGFPPATLSTIVQPTLVLHGRDDRVVPADCGLLIHRCVPRSDLHMFGQCGHWVQLEREAAFLALVRRHLAEA